MGARYSITCADLAGCSWSVPAHTLTEAAAEVVRAALNPQVYGLAFSSDDAEHDGERWHDGLTDDERDVLDAAQFAGSQIRRAVRANGGATCGR